MGIKRIIEIETLDDLADYIAERAQQYEDEAASYRKINELHVKSRIPQKRINEARHTGLGLRHAERIVRDSVFKDKAKQA